MAFFTERTALSMFPARNMVNKIQITLSQSKDLSPVDHGEACDETDIYIFRI